MRRVVQLEKLFSREELITRKLVGKIKNFSGKGPAVIKVNIDKESLVIKLKWIVTESLRTQMNNEHKGEDFGLLHREFIDLAEKKLLMVLPSIFSEFRIKQIETDIYQENLTVYIDL